jgi:hypothetical protein
MRRLDTNAVENDAPECRVIITVRNEALKLPWLLTYYRSLGAARFFVIDNGSTDSSLQFLGQQKDCHVFYTTDSYGSANAGVAWQTEVLQQFTGPHWWLIIDADEILVYPSSEKVRLPDFCRSLDAAGAEGLYTILLDMYSSGPVSEAFYESGQPFTEVCNCFDTEYKFRKRLKGLFAPVPFPPLEPVGGPRLRRFYSEYCGDGGLAVARTKILRRCRNMLRRMGLRVNVDLAVPPALFKIPLLKWKPGITLINSHRVSPIKLASLTGALLHFKFFADFYERVMEEVERGQHFDNASEYARYRKVLKADPEMSFYYHKSATYKDTAQLVKLGLMRGEVTDS